MLRAIAIGLLFVVVAQSGCAWSRSQPIVIRDIEATNQHVGQIVRLEGEVTNTKCPTILGVDVEMPSRPIPGSDWREVIDLRGKRAIAIGKLMEYEIPESVKGQSRAAGKYMTLIDPQTGEVAVAQSLED
jgi:hypothetical protein